MDPRYPIGKYIEQPFTEGELQKRLLDIQSLPQLLEHAIINLDEAQLDTPYREEGGQLNKLCIMLQTVILMPMSGSS